jgi:hypothetical protein
MFLIDTTNAVVGDNAVFDAVFKLIMNGEIVRLKGDAQRTTASAQ